jgi:hypothetical protein
MVATAPQCEHDVVSVEASRLPHSLHSLTVIDVSNASGHFSFQLE